MSDRVGMTAGGGDGFGLDLRGELIAYCARLSNVPRFLGPERVRLVNAGQLPGSTRFMMRTGPRFP